MDSQQDLNGIKEKLIEQIKQNYPEDQSNEFIQNINSMDDNQFVEFLKQQGLIQGEGSDKKCIFCSMVFGEIPTTKIGENNSAIAILELNPISKGHSLIIPKNHVSSPEELGDATKELAQEISKKIMGKFNPKKVEITSSNVMGHEVLNALPIYENETFESPRNKKNPEELAQLKAELDEVELIEEKKDKEEEQKEEKTKEDLSSMKIPKRIP